MNNSSNNKLERRSSFRLDMHKELVDIVWLTDKGQEVSKQIVCVNFSRGGLKLDCDSALPLHTAVTIIFKSAAANNQKLFGKVLRCIQQCNGSFEIGVLLDKSE